MLLSMQLHTGIDYLMEMPFDDLNEIAESVAKAAEEVAAKYGQK